MLASEVASGGRHELALTRRQLAIAVALHVVVAFALLHNAWADPEHSVVGPSLVDAHGYGGNGIPNGDSLQLVWFMKWTPFAVTHFHNPLITTYQNAPTGANLMWDALMPVAGLIVSPVTFLAGPIVGFNLLATLAIAICGLAATVCTSRFVRRPISAVVGGLAFQVSPFVVAQSQGHQSVVLAAAFVPCLMVLALDVLVSRRRTVLVGGTLLGLAAAVTFYTWEETLLSTAMMTMVGAIVAALVAPQALRASLTKSLACLAVAAGVALVLAAPGLVIQFFGPMHLAAGVIRNPNTWVIDAQNIITPTSSQWLVPRAALTASRSWTGNSFEWGGYMGVPLLLTVVVVAITLWRRRDVRWLVAMLVVGLLLSLGPTLHAGGHDTGALLPWSLLARLPLLQDILAARLAVFPSLAGALLLAIAVEALIMKRMHAVATVLVTAVALTLLPTPLPAQPVSIPAFFSSGSVNRVAPGTVVLIAPYATPLAPQPLIWQASSGMRFRMPEGYVSLSSPEGDFLESPPATATSTMMEAVAAGQPPVVDNNLRQAVLADLQRWTVHVVIVGPMPHEDEMIGVFSDMLGHAPARVDGVAVWWDLRS